MASNNNSANFKSNICQILELPKWLATKIPTLDGKSKMFKLFEVLLQTSLETHNQQTEENRINYFFSLLRGDASQTFKVLNIPTRQNLGEKLTVFRRNNAKPQSLETAKHKIQKLVFNPANQKRVFFPDEI